jgi:small subunit ribosomal protein S3
MIEKELLGKMMRTYIIEDYLSSKLPKGSYSKIELRKTPLGEKIIVHTSRPGLIVGRKGANIQSLTKVLKDKFKMENPQIDVTEIENPSLDPRGIADKIVTAFERYGPKRFKSLGYRALQEIMDAKAIGAEIVITGRGVPSSRSRRWRFMAGHLKKSGDIAHSFTKKALTVAHLSSGAVGIQVRIITPDTILPDDIKYNNIIEVKEEKVEEKPTEEKVEKKPTETVKKPIKKKSTKKEKNEEKGTKTTK